MNCDGERTASEKTARGEHTDLLYRLGRFAARTIGAVLFGVRIIKGSDTLPQSGACIAAGNHISFVDPILLAAGQKRQIHYMAKAELFKNPLLKWICSAYGAFPVERGSADVNSVRAAMRLLKRGRVLGVFPEGTRSKDGNLGTGKAGTVMIAYRSGAPIYPFAVYAKKGFRLFCRYIIAFGQPVTAQELGITEGKTSEYRTATRNLMKIISDLRDECIKADNHGN